MESRPTTCIIPHLLRVFNTFCGGMLLLNLVT